MNFIFQIVRYIRLKNDQLKPICEEIESSVFAVALGDARGVCWSCKYLLIRLRTMHTFLEFDEGHSTLT